MRRRIAKQTVASPLKRKRRFSDMRYERAADFSLGSQTLRARRGNEPLQFARRPNPQDSAGFRHLSARLRHHGVNPCVVVVGIVMKKDELLDLGAQSECDAIVKTTMPPADVRRIFNAVILRIENQHFAALEELHQFLLGGARDASYLRAQRMN